LRTIENYLKLLKTIEHILGVIELELKKKQDEGEKSKVESEIWRK
jgi:hypothetical protein